MSREIPEQLDIFRSYELSKPSLEVYNDGVSPEGFKFLERSVNPKT